MQASATALIWFSWLHQIGYFVLHHNLPLAHIYKSIWKYIVPQLHIEKKKLF